MWDILDVDASGEEVQLTIRRARESIEHGFQRQLDAAKKPMWQGSASGDLNNASTLAE